MTLYISVYQVLYIADIMCCIMSSGTLVIMHYNPRLSLIAATLETLYVFDCKSKTFDILM